MLITPPLRDLLRSRMLYYGDAQRLLFGAVLPDAQGRRRLYDLTDRGDLIEVTEDAAGADCLVLHTADPRGLVGPALTYRTK